MIDAGMSRRDIRAYVSTLTDLPVSKVINTHSHWDHTGANGFFDVVYITEYASRSAKNPIGIADPADYPMDYDYTFIHDAEIINIEGRPLEIIELDCHSQGNIAILDINNRMLFTGDELESGQILLLPGFGEKPGEKYARPASTVEKYLRTLEKIKTFENRYDAIFPAHNGTPIDTSYLETYMEAAQRILDGIEGIEDCSSPTYDQSLSHFPKKEMNYRRMEWKGASIVYCKDRIWDRQADIPPIN
jgi:glyoxylase-like metal-dependent hydrolase (beta-lactamase superfamily II)